jgi:hypothetical protein
MRSAWDNECAASEEQFKQNQRRETESNTVGVDLATLRRSFCCGRAMLVTTVSDISDAMMFACIQHQAQTAAVTKANAYRLGINMISRSCFFEGCRRFFAAQVTGAVKLRMRIRALQPNWINRVAFNVFYGRLVGVDQQLLTKYIRHRVIRVFKSLKQVPAWNMTDAVQQLVRCIKLNQGEIKHPHSIAE